MSPARFASSSMEQRVSEGYQAPSAQYPRTTTLSDARVPGASNLLQGPVTITESPEGSQLGLVKMTSTETSSTAPINRRTRRAGVFQPRGGGLVRREHAYAELAAIRRFCPTPCCANLPETLKVRDTLLILISTLSLSGSTLSGRSATGTATLLSPAPRPAPTQEKNDSGVDVSFGQMLAGASVNALNLPSVEGSMNWAIAGRPASHGWPVPLMRPAPVDEMVPIFRSA